MRINIFAKLLFSYIFVILAAMSLAAGLQYVLIKDYLIESKENELLANSKELAEVVKPLMIKGIDPHPAVNSFNRAERRLGTEAWVMDKNAKVLAASADHLYCEGNTLESADLEQLRAGQVRVRRGQSQYFREAVIRVAVPILGENTFLGAVILYTPVTGINETFFRMERIWAGSAAFGMALAFLLGLIISRYITGPLLEITRVAGKVAEGNFQEQVSISSRDEFGEVAAAINYMTEKLADYEKMRRDFVANVSHELRSPLTSIKGFITALIEGKGRETGEQEKYLYILQKETDRLTKLVNDLLEISRFDAREAQLSIEPFAISSVIHRAVASLRPQYEKKDLILKTTVQKNIPLCDGDEDRIEQVIHNLLENAVRYSSAGGTVLISATKVDDEILVEIADTGPGIPKEDLHKIWERFYRVDKARSRNEGGTGLGLSIVQEIVRKHGGRVMVDSQLGEGTVFAFTIPAAADTDSL